VAGAEIREIQSSRWKSKPMANRADDYWHTHHKSNRIGMFKYRIVARLEVANFHSEEISLGVESNRQK